MIVISDTSPIRYLILIDAVDLLPRIYGQVIVPEAVVGELVASTAPEEVKNFVNGQPEWLRITKLLRPVETALLEKLDLGESQAIQLASEIGAGLLLIDEKRGRRVAVSRGLDVIGTIGVLLNAHDRGWIDFDTHLNRLRQAGFYFSADIGRLQ